MPYSAVNKDPDGVADYSLDYSGDLGGASAADTIATSTWTVPDGITQNSESHTTKTTTIWLSGGTLGQDYELLNRIVSVGGRTFDGILFVRATQHRTVPVGPPYATVAEATDYQPSAEGASAMKIEYVLQDASDIVQRLAPRPGGILAALSASMTDSQDTIPLKAADTLPTSGTVRIGTELLQYFGKTSTGSAGGTYYRGAGNLVNAVRGRHATTAASHALDDVVELVDYPLKARRAELAVFEWLWATRGYIPSKTGVIASESYSIGPEIMNIVKQAMGSYYAGKSKSISVGSTFSKSDSWSKFPDYVGNG